MNPTSAGLWFGLLILFAVVSLIICGEDYYAILGIGKDATNREIRKAFKKLALIHHPDKSKEEDAQTKFLKFTQAYETLKDEEKRKR
jgi:DnaJ-class molecular chaperone